MVDNASRIDWKKVRDVFESLAGKKLVKGHIKRSKDHVAECRRQLDAMKLNPGKKRQLAYVVFQRDFEFDAMADKVKGLYDRV